MTKRRKGRPIIGYIVTLHSEAYTRLQLLMLDVRPEMRDYPPGGILQVGDEVTQFKTYSQAYRAVERTRRWGRARQYLWAEGKYKLVPVRERADIQRLMCDGSDRSHSALGGAAAAGSRSLSSRA
jgi:hypothetical protein